MVRKGKKLEANRGDDQEKPLSDLVQAEGLSQELRPHIKSVISKKNSLPSGLSEYKLPKNIEVNENEACIRTDSGEFHMPLEMFNLYIKRFTLDQNNFTHFITYYIGDGRYDKNQNTIDTRRKTKEFMASKGLRPEDYLDKYGYGPNEKTPELINILPKEIIDEAMFNQIIFHFSPHSASDNITYFEHCLLASSSSEFFGHPFMGGFRSDLEWQRQSRVKREEGLRGESRISSRKQQALILFTNREEYRFGENTFLNKTEAGSKELREEVRNRLKQLYQAIGGPIPFEEIDYARVVLKPVPFDIRMEAIPKPIQLEFLHNKNIVASTNDPVIVKSLKFKKEDFSLADALVDSLGNNRSIQMQTKGFVHTLKFSDAEIPNWYDSYLMRISK